MGYSTLIIIKPPTLIKKIFHGTILYESLIKSIEMLQKSKYGKGNKSRLTSIQSALKRSSPLFGSEDSGKRINFRSIEQIEHIPKILDVFADSFEAQCLRNGKASAKNYSIFSVTLLKIVKTMDADKRRGLLSAHAINRLNQMFTDHPVEYKKSEIRDPLRFVFVIIELAIDTEKNLSKDYEFDEILLQQISPLMQRYYMKFDSAVRQVILEFEKMSKFRLTVSIEPRHGQLVQILLQYAMRHLPLKDKISRAENMIEKISCEENDSVILEYYNVLKLSFDDKELIPHLKEIIKPDMVKRRRFASTILDEISSL